MKESIYKFKFNRVLLKSISVWICLAVQACLSFLIIYNEGTIITLILLNLIFSTLSIPGIILHLNYLKHTSDKLLIVRYNSISFIDGDKETILNSFDINTVILHESPSGSKFPWWDYSWFELIDKEGQSIKISCYLLDISDFWRNSLTRRVNSNNLKREQSLFPMIK
ncbi:MAG: hypothetical protein K0S23_288 [Fluviicola sp.]|jgi:hypothetical protein|nr:hypothetical protein [Fluviicola sp.]